MLRADRCVKKAISRTSVWSPELGELAMETCEVKNCRYCSRSGRCLLCESSFLLDERGNCLLRNVQCAANEFSEFSECRACRFPCAECFDGRRCLQCAEHFQLVDGRCLMRSASDVALNLHYRGDNCAGHSCIQNGHHVPSKCEKCSKRCDIAVEKCGKYRFNITSKEVKFHFPERISRRISMWAD